MAKDFPGRIVYVPGKNPKPDPLLHRALLWRVLQSGLTAAQPACAAALDGEAFNIAAWNHIYYGAEREPPNYEAIERLLAGDWDARHDQAEAETWRVKVQLGVRRIADRFPLLLEWLSDPAIRDVIAETSRYFDQQDRIGRQVREVLKSPLRRWLTDERPVLVLGHSLGSVIAWDALWELTHEEGVAGKLEFVTMGSPLGLHFTQARLLGTERAGAARYPHMIEAWHNIAAVGDLVSLDPTLADDFSEMVDLGLVREIVDYYEGVYAHYRDEEGLNPHRAYGYLVNPVVAARVAAWWWNNR